MRLSEAIAYFGTQRAVAKALGIKPPSVANWGEDVPPLRQIQLERITGGKLRADPAILSRPRIPPAQ